MTAEDGPSKRQVRNLLPPLRWSDHGRSDKSGSVASPERMMRSGYVCLRHTAERADESTTSLKRREAPEASFDQFLGPSMTAEDGPSKRQVRNLLPPLRRSDHGRNSETKNCLSKSLPDSSCSETGARPTVCFLGENEDEICNIDEPETTPIEVIWDTGCCQHVADKLDLPGYTIHETEKSKRGHSFKDASGNDLRNEGEIVAQLVERDKDGKKIDIESRFQVTAVTRPLWSIGQILDNQSEGATVTFKRHEAILQNAAGKILAKAERKGRGGMYIGLLHLKNPRSPSFGRPEKK